MHKELSALGGELRGANGANGVEACHGATGYEGAVDMVTVE